MSQYQKLLRESSEQFEFGGVGSLSNREGSRRKKKGGKKQSSRKSKKKDRHDDSEPVGGVRMEEQVHVQQPARTQVRVCDHTSSSLLRGIPYCLYRTPFQKHEFFRHKVILHV